MITLDRFKELIVDADDAFIRAAEAHLAQHRNRAADPVVDTEPAHLSDEEVHKARVAWVTGTVKQLGSNAFSDLLLEAGDVLKAEGWEPEPPRPVLGAVINQGDSDGGKAGGPNVEKPPHTDSDGRTREAQTIGAGDVGTLDPAIAGEQANG